jgi:hypothetical protein
LENIKFSLIYSGQYNIKTIKHTSLERLRPPLLPLENEIMGLEKTKKMKKRLIERIFGFPNPSYDSPTTLQKKATVAIVIFVLSTRDV